jgi:hypothetical protein
MFNLKGNLYSTTDLQFAMNEAQKPNVKVMLIDDIDTSVSNRDNVIYSGVLLPPYDAICAYESGNIQQFQSIYTYHITMNCIKIIAAIVSRLMMGDNIMPYIPPHIYEQVTFFLLHMQSYHGIVCGNEKIPFNYNTQYNDTNLSYLFKLDYIDSLSFLIMLQDTEIVLKQDGDLLKKLILDINPFITPPTVNGYINYFTGLAGSMKSANTLLRPAIKTCSITSELIEEDDY